MKSLKNMIISAFLLFPVCLSAQGAQTEAGNKSIDSKSIVVGPEAGEVLIDFSELSKDINSTELDLTTESDYIYSGASSKIQPEDMKPNLSIDNWGIVLTPSARLQAYVDGSSIASASVNSDAKRYAGESILGVRIFFPEYSQSSATIVPPFQIPYYSGENGNQFLGKGLIDNVKNVKELKVTVYGMGYDGYLEVLLEDMKGREYVYPVGTLKFKGWADLIWSNPNYLSNLNARIIKDKPNYPSESNKLMLKGFRVSKPHASYEQHFVFFIKDVRVIYEKLEIDKESDINFEAVFKEYRSKGIQNLRKLKLKEALKRILRIRERLAIPEGTFKDFLQRSQEDDIANPKQNTK